MTTPAAAPALMAPELVAAFDALLCEGGGAPALPRDWHVLDMAHGRVPVLMVADELAARTACETWNGTAGRERFKVKHVPASTSLDAPCGAAAALTAYDAADAAYRAAWTAEQGAVAAFRASGAPADYGRLETARRAASKAIDALDEAGAVLAPYCVEDEDVEAVRARLAREAAVPAEPAQSDLFAAPALSTAGMVPLPVQQQQAQAGPRLVHTKPAARPVRIVRNDKGRWVVTEADGSTMPFNRDGYAEVWSLGKAVRANGYDLRIMDRPGAVEFDATLAFGFVHNTTRKAVMDRMAEYEAARVEAPTAVQAEAAPQLPPVIEDAPPPACVLTPEQDAWLAGEERAAAADCRARDAARGHEALVLVACALAVLAVLATLVMAGPQMGAQAKASGPVQVALALAAPRAPPAAEAAACGSVAGMGEHGWQVEAARLTASTGTRSTVASLRATCAPAAR